jgi:hypothetical protein
LGGFERRKNPGIASQCQQVDHQPKKKGNIMEISKSFWIIRILLAFFMAGLIFSGLSAFPLMMEINILGKFIGNGSWVANILPDLAQWISLVQRGLNDINENYPFIFYGTDWLAFAHITIAISFLGPMRNPVRNIWVVEFGMIACVLLIPMALLFGFIRGIPFFWTVVDWSFGIFGLVPLVIAHRQIKRIIELMP